MGITLIELCGFGERVLAKYDFDYSSKMVGLLSSRISRQLRMSYRASKGMSLLNCDHCSGLMMALLSYY